MHWKKKSTEKIKQQNIIKRLLNVKETSCYLGVSAAAVYRYVEWGMLTYRRLPSVPTRENRNPGKNGRIVFEMDDLDYFLDSRAEKRNGDAV